MFHRWVFVRFWAGLNGGCIVCRRQQWLPFFKSDEISLQVIISVTWTVEDGEAYGNWSKPLDKYARKYLLPTIDSPCSVTVPYSQLLTQES